MNGWHDAFRCTVDTKRFKRMLSPQNYDVAPDVPDLVSQRSLKSVLCRILVYALSAHQKYNLLHTRQGLCTRRDYSSMFTAYTNMLVCPGTAWTRVPHACTDAR